MRVLASKMHTTTARMSPMEIPAVFSDSHEWVRSNQTLLWERADDQTKM